LDSLISRHLLLHPSNPGTTVLELLLVLSNICLKSKDAATFKAYLERSQIAQAIDQAKGYRDPAVRLRWFILQVLSKIMEL
jgi:hypothetical protein